MAERVEFVPRPFVRERYEPANTGTLLELMRLASQARSESSERRATVKSQGLLNIGQLISQALGSIRQDREQRDMNAAVMQRQQREDVLKQRDQQLREADLLARISERDQARQAVEQTAVERRGDQRAKAIGYGPMGEADVDTVMQSPERAGDVRYSFGPGTADGPELQPTPEQQRGIQTEQSIAKMGGTIGPNGQVIMPPKVEPPPREPNPTEASLALLAAQGNQGAIKALEIIRAQRPRSTSGSSEPRTLTQTAEAQIINRLSTQWNAVKKPIRELDRQVQLMNSGMAAVDRGDMAQGAQAVLVTFQKILDPPSVVRESEYMRSSAGQSLINRVKGAYQKLTDGGAGVTPDQLRKFAQLAQEAATAQRKASGIDAIRSRLSKTAARYNIPDELVFEDEDSSAPPPPPSVPPAVPPKGGFIEAIDPQGNIHHAAAGTPLPPGWRLKQ